MSKTDSGHFTQAQKFSILRRHFVDKVPVSDLCAEHKMHVSTFYLWQKKMFEGELGDGKRQPPAREKDLERENAALKAKLAKKAGVIAEVTPEYVALKKVLGKSERSVDAARGPRRRCGLRAEVVCQDGAHCQ